MIRERFNKYRTWARISGSNDEIAAGLGFVFGFISGVCFAGLIF